MDLETGKQNALKVVYGRTLVVILTLLIQVGILVVSYTWLAKYQTYTYGAFTVLAAILVLVIINSDTNPAFKLAWIIPILVAPIFGGLFYIFVHVQHGPKLINKRLKNIIQSTQPYLEQSETVREKIGEESGQAKNLTNYLAEIGGYPTYSNTDVEYFPLGEDKFKRLIEELGKAEKYIFLEYFIIEESYMWDTILNILKEKVKEGVEVRVMYDGTCSLSLLPYSYPKVLRAAGIKCKMFSPVKPVLSTYQNNRDHRKVLVIDGHTAFTGGINFGDEYINRKQRFGHWKDTAVMLKGSGARGFTVMFLQMWNVDEKQLDDFSKYVAKEEPDDHGNKGFVTPYGDSPLDEDNVGEHVYMDIINTAKDYVHIMTPYLILDNEMLVTLSYAAKRGVDVKLILPHIPDKKYAFMLAHSHYPRLLSCGVKIYEYTPGFVHAKVFSSDDEKAVVGTINMDYRSLYLHFECGAYMYKCPVIKDIETDFQETLSKCQPMTMDDYKKLPLLHKIGGHILKLFAPLM